MNAVAVHGCITAGQHIKVNLCQTAGRENGSGGPAKEQ